MRQSPTRSPTKRQEKPKKEGKLEENEVKGWSNTRGQDHNTVKGRNPTVLCIEQKIGRTEKEVNGQVEMEEQVGEKVENQEHKENTCERKTVEAETKVGSALERDLSGLRVMKDTCYDGFELNENMMVDQPSMLNQDYLITNLPQLKGRKT